MQLSFIILMLTPLIKISVTEYASYNNYRVYEIIFQNNEQYQAFLKFNKDEEFEVSFDQGPKEPLIIIVPPFRLAKFLDFVTENGVTFKLEIENLGSLIEAEKSRLESRINRSYDWGDYNPLDKVYSWLDKLEEIYNNVKVINVGYTFQRRRVKGIEIYNGENFPWVVIESGMHAREWITIAGTSFVVNEILKSHESIWKAFNYLYFPSFNPDGYVYTWTTDRLWRKTRSVHMSGSKICYGVDGNRNFPAGWGGPGSSREPCSLNYRGPTPFSEVEIKSITDYLLNTTKSKNYKIFISYHSYGQWIGFPYGYKKEWAPHHQIWQKIGNLAAEAYTEAHGTEIRAVRKIGIKTPVSGLSVDWYYEKLNATISFLYEMRDQGRFGFILPPEEIIPVGEEHFASLRRILIEYQKLKNAKILKL